MKSTAIGEEATTSATAGRVAKRVILSMGGKGGVGKTRVMTGLAEWFDANEIPATLLDLDTENKARGSLGHFFGERAPKVNIHTPAGLDAFVDHLADGEPVILADMGAGSGRITHDWFDKMYLDVAEAGIAFTGIGIVTDDPASVESVLWWAARLQNRVAYLIVENIFPRLVLVDLLNLIPMVVVAHRFAVAAKRTDARTRFGSATLSVVPMSSLDGFPARTKQCTHGLQLRLVQRCQHLWGYRLRGIRLHLFDHVPSFVVMELNAAQQTARRVVERYIGRLVAFVVAGFQGGGSRR